MTLAQNSVRFFIGLMFTIGTTFAFANEQHGHEGEHNAPVHAEAHEAHEGHEEAHGEHDADHGGHGYEGMIDTQEEIQAYKEHHLQDAHDFVLFSDNEKGTHFGFPLPVILWDGETGMHFFMSSKFHHGETVAESNGAYFKLAHGKVVKTDAEGHADLGQPIDFSITKNVLGMLVAGLLMIWMFSALARSYKRGPVPTGIGRVLEPLVLYVRDEIARPNIGEKHYKKFMSFLLTVFFFIWILNLLGLTPLAFNVTGNIAVTACLALFTFVIVQFSGNKNYWGHIFWMPGVPVPMKIILAPIEVLGMFTKPFSLLIRLFANITAGHMVLMSLIALTIVLKAQFGAAGSTAISLFLSLFISLIELLVAFLQAYIFTMLSSLFIGMAVEEHH
ncbi:F0F1 ATP synthase subunit A [Lishizhenia sp.]|uniref:F0F1 ATP synthase subunit A n=1 Tax=Lishizhenia sp. TaxID=2497594 RepID=UPI00299DBC5C|nr:F0F1 ATP synthase subunit A [Lishizhenia sp.]MDX1446021.1 F0F1 ATP synthase subunit A [Lishizhenia sp.]